MHCRRPISTLQWTLQFSNLARNLAKHLPGSDCAEQQSEKELERYLRQSNAWSWNDINMILFSVLDLS